MVDFPYTRADWLLALIPLPLVVGMVAGVVSSLSLAATVGASSIPASGLVGYAVFCMPVSEWGIEGESFLVK